jgi:hypothetical protein
MSRMALGWVVISFVVGSRMVVRFGWSLALGWRPAEVLRLAWYRFGLDLYKASSFFLSLSISLRFALLMIVEIALWQREGMSSMLGGSVVCRMLVICVDEWVVSFLGPAFGGLLCDGCVVGSFLVVRRTVSLRSFVRRLSWRLSEFVRGVCIFSVSCGLTVCAIGQFVCASSWYAVSMLMMVSAALSMLAGVIWWELVSFARAVDASRWVLMVLALPS